MVRETSIAVYRQIEKEGLLSRLRFLVYDTLFHHGPITAMEACEILRRTNRRVKQVSISPRMSELQRMGVVKECGEKICSITNHVSICWDVTANLPRKLDKDMKKTKNQIIEELKKENTKLREQIAQLQDPLGINALHAAAKKQLGFDFRR